MENVLAIATQPDNIPIIGMLVLTLVCLGSAMKQAFRHDRLIKKARKIASSKRCTDRRVPSVRLPAPTGS